MIHMGPLKVPCPKLKFWFVLPPMLLIPQNGTHNQPDRNQWIILDVFSISASIYNHTLYIMNSTSLISPKCFHFPLLLFFYLNLSHSHLLPQPMHSLPMTVLFSLSSPLVHPLEQSIVSGAGLPMNAEWWMWMVPPWVACTMALIWNNLLKIKTNHDSIPLQCLSLFLKF